MSRGRRYEEPKLNMKKVVAVIVAFAVIIMFIVVLNGILTKDKEQGKITSKSYFTVFKDNKWGIIDSSGETVIDPSYQEMIIVPNNKKEVFLCVYDVNYETGEYKTKAINSKEEKLFTDYEQIEAIPNKDINNNLWYENNAIKVKKDGKYGVINLEGKQIAECQYEEITTVEGIENAIKVKKDGKYGVIDSEGKEILKPEYIAIEALGKDNKAGYIVQNDERKYGIVDYSNNKVLESQYEAVEKINRNNCYIVKKDGKQVLIKKDGTEILKDGYDEIKDILKNQDAGIIYKKDNKYGIKTMSGEEKISAKYEDLVETRPGIFIAKKDGKYGIIDIDDNKKLEFKYNSLKYKETADIYIGEDEKFNNEILDNNYEVKLTGILTDLNEEKGYLELRKEDGSKYYNFKFEEKEESDIFASKTLYVSKKDGKYGFVDKTGKIVVDYIYDDATMQNEYGFAGIKKDGKWGSIDSKGDVVQEPTHNLDDYLIIDYIGRWHYGKDINMNYYR